ncbi:MAG: bifunctional riboflavin kinase/FAD synthetase [Acidobacteriota bacterium]
MRVIRNSSELPTALPYPVLAIGAFDGVHRGHQEVLRRLVAEARRREGTAVVLSFHPHPQQVIRPGTAPPLLQTFEQQAEQLEALGVDLLVRFPFTREVSLWSPEEFVKEVLVSLGVQRVLVGENFRFGHRREGDFLLLQRLGERFGFAVEACPVLTFRGQRISSTRIRRLVSSGCVEAAARLLGRPYEMRGDVVVGDQRGRRMGFPTANLEPENPLLPANGVYVTRLEVEGRWWTGATNIGYRPTVKSRFRSPRPLVETHLLDFDGDLYGRYVKLAFCCRIRPEAEFADLEALIQRIRRDILFIRRYEARWERQKWSGAS